jgi:hypothetical protein
MATFPLREAENIALARHIIQGLSSRAALFPDRLSPPTNWKASSAPVSAGATG